MRSYLRGALAALLLSSAGLVACEPSSDPSDDKTGDKATATKTSTATSTATSTSTAVRTDDTTETTGQADCTPGDSESCYDGPDATRDVGLCRAGQRTCGEDGRWGRCDGQVRPTADSCTTEGDDDCDLATSPCPAGEACAEGACVACDDPPAVSGADALELAGEFSQLGYRVFDLGPVPGVPGPLGGCVLMPGQRDTLLIAGASEAASGAIYAVQLKRNACGHIVGFVDGSTRKVADTPHVDANLVFASERLLLYTRYSSNRVGQLLFDAAGKVTTQDKDGWKLADGGVDASVGGLGIVPAGLTAAGGLRSLSWSGGEWNELTVAQQSGSELLSFVTAQAVEGSRLPNGPGGFGYIPAGSPGFEKQSLIVSEWSANSVGVYEVDEQGNPIKTSRRDFFSSFPRPWGAYFEQQTGDFLFLNWTSGSNRVAVVQGFVPPAPQPQVSINRG